MEIQKLAQEQFDYMVKHRRHLHTHPEMSGKEFETVQYIMQELRALQIPSIEVENGGVLGFIKGTRLGKTVLLRADVDALPIQEPKVNLKAERVCISQNDGVMHACGHDAHTSMLLGAAKILNLHRDEIKGEVLLVFERGEEAAGNIRQIMHYMEDHEITWDGAWGLHCFQDMPTGTLGIRAGGSMAGSLVFRYKITGEGGHGSRPDLSKSPIDCMLAVLDDLYKAPMKYTNPFEPFTLSIGLIQAGTVQNVIPDTAEFAGTARFFDEEKSALPFLKHMAESAEAYSKLYDCKIDYTVRHGKPLINQPDATRLAWDAISAVVGADHVVEGMPAMGSESFPAYANYAPACFGKLGIANPEVGSGAEIHNQFFDIDEKAMINGAAATIAFALAFLNSETVIPFTPFAGNVTDYYAESLKEVHFGE